MKYNEIESQEFTSDKPVLFKPPKKMVCWDCEQSITEDEVYAYIPDSRYPAKTDAGCFRHCAEILEELKPRRATNRELAKWLAQGKGEKKRLDKYEKEGVVFASIEFTYELGDADRPVDECYFIRRWNETEWHAPTIDYMGLEG